jgi:inorganic pyrophosphatase
MGVDLSRLPPRNKQGACLVVVESPRGSSVKLKFDPELGAFSVSRPLPWGLVYPFDWGFVPGTKASDGDPLDAMILWDAGSAPGVVIPCRAIGVLNVEQDGKDGRQRNDRVLCLPLAAPRHNEVKDVSDLSERERTELVQFFLSSTVLEKKNLKILGWAGAPKAEQLIDDSRAK